MYSKPSFHTTFTPLGLQGTPQKGRVAKHKVFSIKKVKENYILSHFMEKKYYFADIFLFLTLITHVLPIAKLCQPEKGIFTYLKLSLFICLFILSYCHTLKPHCFRHCTNKKQNDGSCLKGLIVLWMGIGRLQNTRKQWHNKDEWQWSQHTCSAKCFVGFFWWAGKDKQISSVCCWA